MAMDGGFPVRIAGYARAIAAVIPAGPAARADRCTPSRSGLQRRWWFPPLLLRAGIGENRPPALSIAVGYVVIKYQLNI
jgi:hypothetical protein